MTAELATAPTPPAITRGAPSVVHHLRELTFLEEEYHQAWAGELKVGLRQMGTAAKQTRARGQPQVPSASAPHRAHGIASC